MDKGNSGNETTSNQETTKMQWRPFNDECPVCGAGAEVYTSSDQDNYAYNSEEARCEMCGHRGVIMFDMGETFVDWQ